MPLKNDISKTWIGWLIDGAGGRENEVRDRLVLALRERNIPKSVVKPDTVNMWWRKDSLVVDVTSSMDGIITSTLHVMEYGTSLWIGRAAESHRQTNYYKRMASAAFLDTVDRVIRTVIDSLFEASAVHTIDELHEPESAEK